MHILGRLGDNGQNADSDAGHISAVWRDVQPDRTPAHDHARSRSLVIQTPDIRADVLVRDALAPNTGQLRFPAGSAEILRSSAVYDIALQHGACRADRFLLFGIESGDYLKYLNGELDGRFKAQYKAADHQRNGQEGV